MDRSLFIQHDIGACYIDDWLVLPEEQVFGVLYEKLTPANERHASYFAFTH